MTVGLTNASAIPALVPEWSENFALIGEIKTFRRNIQSLRYKGSPTGKGCVAAVACLGSWGTALFNSKGSPVTRSSIQTQPVLPAKLNLRGAPSYSKSNKTTDSEHRSPKYDVMNLLSANGIHQNRHLLTIEAVK